MLGDRLTSFRFIWFIDFEFTPVRGGRPKPICMVAREWRSGREIRLWRDELRTLRKPPFSTGCETLIVAYAASAELTCFLALGWSLPENVLDLFVEYRARSNLLSAQKRPPASLLAALRAYTLYTIDDEHKAKMQQLAVVGGPFSTEQQEELIEYCAADVDALARLAAAMLPSIDLPRALLRGRYVRVSSAMEDRGVPIDVEMLARLSLHWSAIKQILVNTIDIDYRVFENGVFKQSLFEAFLEGAGFAQVWPRTARGLASHDKDDLRDMARAHPSVEPLATLMHITGQMRGVDLPVGLDGRNRANLWPFGALTSRNTPRGSIFGQPKFLRSLIAPTPGMAIAYLDFEQQEWAIAASLSKDRAMTSAYVSGDPYMRFAIQAGAAPPNATKETHANAREQFKQAALAVQYAMGPEGLAARLAVPVAEAKRLLDLHRSTYGTMWQWSDAFVDDAFLAGVAQTVLGWPLIVDETANPRSVRNFPMQAHGAEMLRAACILGEGRGLNICMPVHDAVLIEAPADEITDAAAAMKLAMEDASEIVLDDPALRVRAEISQIVKFPAVFREKHAPMWQRIQDALQQVEMSAGATSLLHERTPGPSLSLTGE